jgi:hydroxyacyl-ACP dehydratase HTD2-like protein with hotdog domain
MSGGGMRPIKKTPQPKENQISENHSVVAIGASAPQPHADRSPSEMMKEWIKKTNGTPVNPALD